MRGTLSGKWERQRNHGIIPAYAGNTGMDIMCRGLCRDHPRVCGEHHGSRAGSIRVLGSSPRMRGTLRPPTRCRCCCGIIPAYAGNTSLSSCFLVIGWDHPRICGEHGLDEAGAGLQTGSSPRMRGTHAPMVEVHGLAGIIPAYAGNTSHRPATR